MRILVLDEEFPYPPNSGKRIRSLNLLQRLAANHYLSYLAYGLNSSESFSMLKTLNMNPIAVPPQVPPKSGPLFYPRLFLNLLSKYPYIVTSHYSSLFRNMMNKAILDIEPDLIMCEWTPYARFVRDIDHIKKLVVAHNIETQIWKRYFENEENSIKKWYIGRQAAKLNRFESDAFRWVDGATAVSRKDADIIRSYNTDLAIEIVENGVDCKYFAASYGGQAGNQLIFVGTMDWRPNQDAITYFVREIFPKVREKNTDAEAVFVGRNPPSHIKGLNKIPGVIVTGEVDDVRPYIQRATIYIVPLRIGGGTRLKILDAMAMEKAIVSTPIGAEGLNVTDGENIALADSPREFADRIIELLNDPSQRHSLGKAGRKLVEEHYSWDDLAQKLENFIVRLVENK